MRSRNTLVRCLMVLALLATLVGSVAWVGPGWGNYGSCTQHWTHQQDYYDWGPAYSLCGPVRVYYHATNYWTWHISGLSESVEYLLTQTGHCNVYRLENGQPTYLIGQFTFYAFESIYDQWGDAVTQHGYGNCRYFTVDCAHPNLESYEYSWVIEDGYIFSYHVQGGGGSCWDTVWPKSPQC